MLLYDDVMHTLELRLFLGLSIGVALFFFLFPEIDISFSGLFYEKAAGGFFLNNRAFHVLRSTITNGGRIIPVVLFVLATASLLSNTLKAYLPPQRVLWFLFLAFAVGCNKNRSFVCGDCSVGFATLAFALLAKRQRRRYIAAALAFWESNWPNSHHGGSAFPE